MFAIALAPTVSSDFELNGLIAVTLLCWGIWGILDKKALKNVGSLEVLLRLYSAAIIQVPIAFWWLSRGETSLHHIPATVWLWAAVGAGCQLISLWSYLKAMSMTDASYVLGITAAYPVLAQILAVPMLGEQLVWQRVIGAAAIALGVIAIGSSPRKSASLMTVKSKFALAGCLLAATFGWGIWSLVEKKALLATNNPLDVFAAERTWEITILIAILIIARLQKYHLNLRNLHSWGFSLLSALSLAIGRCVFLGALAISSASYVTTITGCYPLLMYLFALLILKEPFNRFRCLGIALVVLGGLLVQFTQHS